MTKNEFDLLNYVSAHEHAAISDIHASEYFIKVFSGNFIVMDLVIVGLVESGFLKPDPLPDAYLHLDPYTVFTLTPAGAHAMDEYSEYTSRLDRAEASADKANEIAGKANEIAGNSLKESECGNWWAFCAFVLSLVCFIAEFS